MSFVTGKVNALAGYSGAVLLGVFAIGIAGEPHFKGSEIGALFLPENFLIFS